MPESTAGLRRLSEPAWRAAEAAHHARLDAVLGPYLAERSRGRKQPVLDFLFEYYRFRPSHLRRWSPGVNVVLDGDADAFLERPGFARLDGGVGLDARAFPARLVRSTRWIHDLLAATAARPPRFGCGGMHEWAMVYRADDVRHDAPLRMAPHALAAFVESRPIQCTHFDAFRFFTPEARPLNRHQPTHEGMPEMEQPGCLHANMDVYRWAFKRAPWIPSDILADAFFLALRAREIDMRASPYDLAAQGYAPIRVETPEGRVEYRVHQQSLAAEAAPIRERLIEAYARVLSAVEAAGVAGGLVEAPSPA